MNSPRVSIIVPAYNVADYLDAAMRSLLEQSVPPHEILVLDDGSTDHTPDILRSYAHHPRVHLYAHPNRGLGPTRNRGVDLATGDYLYFLDADDWLDTAFVADMQHRIAAHDYPDLVLFSSQSFVDDSQGRGQLYHYRRGFEASGLSGLAALRQLTTKRWLDAPVWIYLARRAYWIDQGLRFPAALFEDESVIVPLLAGASSVLITDQTYHYHRIRAGSITRTELTPRHLHGREDSLRHAITVISAVPRRERRTRRFLRRRCRIFTRKYLDTALELDQPVRRGLLLRAVFATANIRLARTLTRRLYAAGRLMRNARQTPAGTK